MNFATVLRQETILHCRAPHPDQIKYRGKLHEKTNGPPCPFHCEAGEVWTADQYAARLRAIDPGKPHLVVPDGSDGRVVIPYICKCGHVTEWEVMTPEALERREAKQEALKAAAAKAELARRARSRLPQLRVRVWPGVLELSTS